MRDIHYDIMDEIAKTIHGFYAGKYEDSGFVGYCNTTEAKQLCDDIRDAIIPVCKDIENEYGEMEADKEEAEEDKKDRQLEIDDLVIEIEELEEQSERNRMVKQFRYYCERTHG